MALAQGVRRKVLLPLDESVAEFALVRDGDQVLVSCYDTSSTPEILVRNRPVGLLALLEACVATARALARRAPTALGRDLHARLADQLLTLRVVGDESAGAQPVRRRGGAVDGGSNEAPVAFGFTALIPPGQAAGSETSARADVHALLFEGSLWGYVHGTRVPLVTGPILLAVQRMVAAVRAAVDASEAGRPLNIRLRSGRFGIGIRMDRAGATLLTLLPEGLPAVTAPSLTLADATLPILRIASDLLRALVSVDRSQARNLRASSLRDEVRLLRRTLRLRARVHAFTNEDPDRLRPVASDQSAVAPVPAARPVRPGRLRFQERWAIALDEIDASTTYFCGDRLVIAQPRRVLAVSRDDGEVLWARQDEATFSCMAGTALVRTTGEGAVELCDVADGEAYAESRLRPRSGGPFAGLHVAGGGVPPTIVLTEGTRRLVAIDLRTGEPRWRFVTRGPGAFRLTHRGRVLVVVGGDGTIDALDLLSGEVVWRYSDHARFWMEPVISREVVIAASGELGGHEGSLHGIDLYTGERRWRTALDAVPSAPPHRAGRSVVLALGSSRRGSLVAVDPETGGVLWSVPDPGAGTGGTCMAVDEALLVNAPTGRLTCLDLESGALRWNRSLADPVADDVPRQLEPVLRGGALFVPSAAVHVLRPSDGSSLGTPLPCDLVPDLLRVDERGWVYVGEESGHLRAFAPAPQLMLVASRD